MAQKKGLGKGYSAVLSGRKPQKKADVHIAAAKDAREKLEEISVDNLDVNPRQARRIFNDEGLKGLADSIKQSGILQPLVATKKGPGQYILIAGERRLRAARLAGLKKVPVRLIDNPDEQNLAILGLVENLQREDLDPLEEAEAYKMLSDQFDFTQERIGQAVSKSRPYVANTLRLLDLPEKVLDMIRDGAITAGHARAVLRIEGDAQREAFARKIAADGLSVREAENLAVAMTKKKAAKNSALKKAKHPFGHLADDLRVQLGTKVEMAGSGQKGRIVIHYFSENDLTRIYDLLKTD